MLRRLLLATLTLSFLFFAKPVSAQLVPAAIGAAAVVEGVNDIADYCKARSGNVMNLETWYSGKCPSITDALSGGGNEGQSRGFSDIVLLDFLTHIIPGSDVNYNRAAIPAISNILSQTVINPPASGVNYIAHVNKNLEKSRVIKTAYAQEEPRSGVGFNKLLPILPAWEGVRNIAYSLFILVFVVYGFMMMFRTKINPQTVINFEMAIPKLVVTLLAITFSYAIAGLIIDLSLLIPAFLVSVLQNAKVIDLSVQKSFIADIISLIPTAGGGGINAITQLAAEDPVKVISGQSVFGGASYGFQALYELIFTHSIGQIVALFTGLPMWLSTAIAFIPSLIIKVLFVGAVFYVLVKTTFMVIQSYVMIILNIIFAPIILLGNVMPGSQALPNWFRTLISHAAVTPTVIIMFMISVSFLGDSSLIAKGDMWIPPFLSGDTSGGVNTGQGASVILAIGVLFLTPKIADMIKEALKVPAFKYGSAIGDAISFTPRAIDFGMSAKGKMDKMVTSQAEKATALEKLKNERERGSR